MRFTKYATAPGEKARYRVSTEQGTVIGYVFSVRKQTARMHGRIRYPTGHETMWGVDRDGRGRVNSHRVAIYRTRRDAVEALRR